VECCLAPPVSATEGRWRKASNNKINPAPSAEKTKGQKMKKRLNHVIRASRAQPGGLLLAALLLLPITPRLDGAQRPIEDFLVNQGTYFPQGYYVSWLDPRPTGPANWAWIDYAGLDNLKIIEAGWPFLGTIVWGTVNERSLPDGRAEVEVVVHARNALACAFHSPDFMNLGDLVFGHPVEDVLLGAEPTLGNCTLKVRFINTAPAASLPDLFHLLLSPDPGMETISIYFVGQANGLMVDGSCGHLEITQVGLMAASPPKPPMFDSWPVEHILLKRVGDGK